MTAAGLLLLATSGFAEDAPKSWYLTGGGFFELGDTHRGSDNGLGLSLGGGTQLAGRPGESLEVTLNALKRERNVDGRQDYGQSVFAHWLKRFDAKYLLLDAQPYLLFGGGAIREDVRARDHYHAGADAGIGARLKLPIEGWLLRTEALMQAQLNDRSVPNHDFLLDFHVRLGVQIPLGWQPAPSHPGLLDDPAIAPPEAPCEGGVFDPVSGRYICSTDSDRDGVADAADQCPGTARGWPVDSQGCTAKVDDGSAQDEDGDGVIDAADACRGTAPSLTVDATGCLVQQNAILDSVRFETGSALLTSGAKTTLEGVARTLRNQSNLRVRIEGHTDGEGGEQVNQILSQQRAESVRQYLIGKGAAPVRLSAQGYGESQPVADNRSAGGREKNRRVEFKVTLVP